MCASVFIFRWRGGEPIGSVCLHTLVKTDVYLCEWQSYVAPTLQLASRLCQYAEGAGHSVVLQPPPPPCVLHTVVQPLKWARSSGCSPLSRTPFSTHSFLFFTQKLMFLPPPVSDLLSVTYLCAFSEVPVVHLSSGGHSENGHFIWVFMELVLINYPSVTLLKTSQPSSSFGFRTR